MSYLWIKIWKAISQHSWKEFRSPQRISSQTNSSNLWHLLLMPWIMLPLVDMLTKDALRIKYHCSNQEPLVLKVTLKLYCHSRLRAMEVRMTQLRMGRFLIVPGRCSLNKLYIAWNGQEISLVKNSVCNPKLSIKLRMLNLSQKKMISKVWTNVS